VFIDEEHVVLEAGVQVRFESQMDDDRVVMAVDVGVDTVEAFEDLAEEAGESLWERDTWR
jgi:hypothetical protein